MNSRHFLMILYLLLASCNNSSNQPHRQETAPADTLTKGDSTELLSFHGEGTHIRLVQRDTSVFFKAEKGDFRQTWNLRSLGIAWASPEVLWTSEQYACVLTFTSGPYSEWVFLPLREGLSPRPFTKAVLGTDSTLNMICYVDTAVENRYTIAVENLLTGRKKTAQLVSQAHDGFKPLLDKATLSAHGTTLQARGKVYKINL